MILPDFPHPGLQHPLPTTKLAYVPQAYTDVKLVPELVKPWGTQILPPFTILSGLFTFASAIRNNVYY